LEIRDVERLLHLDKLKANVREEHERELASLKHQLDVAVKSNIEQKMAKRYQMVRFVGIPHLTWLTWERQKATRRLRQAEKVYNDVPTSDNQEKVDKYTLDLYYTTHFPLTEKYIALYPKESIESQKVLDKREQIMQQLREEMLHGKKRISGSNKVQLGAWKEMEPRGDRSDKEETNEDGEESERNKESEEDEFLDMGRQK
jgi:hypothetical protein